MFSYFTTKSIRNILVFLCLLMVILISSLAWRMQNIQQTAMEEIELTISFAERAELVQQIETSVIDLQRYALVFRLTENSRIEERFKMLHDQIEGSLALLSGMDSSGGVANSKQRAVLLDRMSNHLSDYRDSFSASVQAKARTLALVERDIGLISSNLQIELSDISIDDLSEIEILELSKLVELVKLESHAYLLKAESSRRLEVERLLENARLQLRSSDIAKQESGKLLLNHLNEYQQVFAQVVSQVQNYLYLNNVVMAGLANEYINLSRELKLSLNTEIAQKNQLKIQYFQKSFQTGLFLSLLLIFISVFFGITMVLCIRHLAKVESELEITTDSYRLTINRARVGIAEVDPNGICIRVNKEVCDYLGYTEQELLDYKFQGLTHPDDLLEEATLISRVIEGEIENYSIEKRYIKKDGLLFWARLNVAVNRDKEGNLLCFIFVVEDINEQKQKQQFLQLSNTELKQEVKEKLIDLQRSNAELEQFAYVASHDLQEPLRMVISYMQIIEKRYKEKLDEDGHEFIGYAVDGARRMQKLIQSLLEYSRLGTRKNDFNSVDMRQVVNDAVQNLMVAIDDADAFIDIKKLPVIQGDKTQLIQLMQNLIANAINYRSEERPEICISSINSDDEWIFTVKDNGIGFDEKYKERIFVIFQRLHGRDKYKGTGIGLSICKKIVERHGGRIWAEPSLNKGSTFFFTLPM